VGRSVVTGTVGDPGIEAPRQFTGQGWMPQSAPDGENWAPPGDGRMPTLLSMNPGGQLVQPAGWTCGGDWT